jgi:glycosyltransferase involved in cell wall biosynthesis
VSETSNRSQEQLVPLRIGVYSDMSYRRDAEGVSTHQAFIRFVSELVTRVEEVVLFGRVDPVPGRSHYALPSDRVRFVALPHYASVQAIAEQIRAVRGTTRAFGATIDGLDAVWIFGPHPMAVALALLARRRGVPVFLGVRQDYPRYIRHRLPGWRWRWAVPVAHLLEHVFRLLARRSPTVAVGDDLAAKYAHPPAPVLSTGFSLIGAAETVDVGEALRRRATAGFTVLTVGRIAQEKNPLLLPAIAAQLVDRDPRWRFVVVGDGPMLPAFRERANALGVGHVFDFRGYVASGEQLWTIYRESDIFLHVSLTEGLPQVLWEAQAAGVPVVATDVGGVRAAVGDSALLIVANDALAAAGALERVRKDAALRRSLIERGTQNALGETVEAQIDRIVDFFVANLDLSTGPRNRS